MVRYRHWKNIGQGPGSVFFTTSVLDFVPVFADPEHAADMTRLLFEIHKTLSVRLSAFVVMPEHVHFLSTFERELTASDFARRVKSFSARYFVPRLSPVLDHEFGQQRGLNGRNFWQRSFRSIPVPDPKAYSVKVRYIHRNPVKRGLSDLAEEYPFSSAKLYQACLWSADEGLMLDRIGVNQSGVFAL